MIIPVDETILLQAATIHSISWKESHRAFCTPDFTEMHTPDRQREYLSGKMDGGTKIYMLVEDRPVGIVSVTDSLIEDLYVLPDMQNRGYGTKSCCSTPWNNAGIRLCCGSWRTIRELKGSTGGWASGKQEEGTGSPTDWMRLSSC